MSSTVDDDNRYAPPTSHVEDVQSGGLELAGRVERLGAAIIDGVVQSIVYFLLAFLLFRRMSPLASANSQSFENILLELVSGFLLFIILQGYWLVTRGQTIGKKLLGLRIVRTDGTQASAGRLLGMRYLIGWAVMAIPIVGVVYALVDTLFIFRASRKCLHDNIADTIVVKA